MSDGEEVRGVIEWRDLLLILLLCLVIALTLDLALEWAARR